ncbi:MAG TPA: hypothetical protein VLC92_04355 [Rhodocyclaceae bacterium]|nr:hypothetical protein [Rhodocyclaceae bacterium]
MRTSHIMLGAAVMAAAGTAIAANRPAGYTTICTEGKTCAVTSATSVAYGRSDQFTYKTLMGSFVCGEVTFGAGAKVAGGTNECSVPTGTSTSSVSSSSSSKSSSSSSKSSSSSGVGSSSSSSVSSSTSSIPAQTGDGLMGWATLASGGVPTGGAGGQSCTATTLATLASCIATASSGANKAIPWTIYVKGYINGATNADGTGFTEQRISRPNTSLIGIVENGVIPTLNAVWIHISGQNNIIVRNVRFINGKDPGWVYEDFSKCTYVDKDYCPSNAEPDGLTLQGVTRGWVDHCEFTDGPDFDGVNSNKAFYKMYDGLLDIKSGADYITLSYNKFSNHDKSILIGSSDVNDGEYHLTFYRNYFQYTGQRTPRVRNAHVHILNNLYENVKKTEETHPYYASYAIGLGFNGKAYSERNAFDITGAAATDLLSANFDAWSQYFTDVGSWLNGATVDLNAAAATVVNAKNAVKNSGKPFIGPVDWAPSAYYSYTPLTTPDTVRSTVKANAGVGKITP